MKLTLIAKSLFTALLLSTLVLANEPANLSKPTEKVKSLIDKYNLEVVDFDYVKKKIGKGTRDSAKVVLIDARPDKKYISGTIPSSLNIPDAEYEKYVGQLKDTPKNTEILVYCGGWACAKSPKVAALLKKDGFTNVKVYQAGEPEWGEKNYLEVGTAVVKGALSKNAAVIIDARPYAKYMQETIPGSISIPDTELEQLKGRFPVNHMEKIITFCGGYKCAKSHIVAKKLISMGYKNVSVYAAGLPAWKEAGLATTKSSGTAKNDKKTNKPEFSKNGAKLGSDEGSIDGEWLYSFIKEDKVPSFIQIVDVTSPEEYNKGHIKGAINIHAEKFSPKELVAKFPKNKTIVFNCTQGGRSMDAWTKIKNAGLDISEIYYFDANIDCKGNDCKIKVNEPLE
ncbi:sulfurtransferase [Halarcobacter ebronensis]|uniref:Sulfurtransferase n=1 Tax=Halarcobacter ebronensis TaxID=1462615 RepID=A0A4Q0YEB4_9BACT|nr:rhodanese-like domain-containing protein [Halarcobacter ebronensis]RXJ67964.1 sulfurtransferase [Halarcobacter ebronensis]